MANFHVAYKIVKQHEGGALPKEIALLIGDTGGETYKGVARNFNPNWAGWKIYDAYKLKNSGWHTYKNTKYFGLPLGHVINDPVLDGLVLKLFKQKYWDVFGLDKLKNQSIANLIFDYTVNGGHVANALTTATGVTKNWVDAINKSTHKKEIFESIKESRLKDINAKKDSFDKQLIERTNSFFFQEEKPL